MKWMIVALALLFGSPVYAAKTVECPMGEIIDIHAAAEENGILAKKIEGGVLKAFISVIQQKYPDFALEPRVVAVYWLAFGVESVIVEASDRCILYVGQGPTEVIQSYLDRTMAMEAQ